MCAISGSFNKDRLKELYKINAYRGEMSYSLSTFESEKNGKVKLMTLMQGQGKLPDILLDNIIESSISKRYLITHSQAPTTDSNNIHPAAYGDAMLWHNGIIKQKSISSGTWDTAWLLEKIIDYGWSSLSRVDGTFACIMFWAGTLYIFRNEISPLYIDKDFNISSTKLPGFESIEPNKVFKIDLLTKQLHLEAYFETMENPYYIPETL